MGDGDHDDDGAGDDGDDGAGDHGDDGGGNDGDGDHDGYEDVVGVCSAETVGMECLHKLGLRIPRLRSAAITLCIFQTKLIRIRNKINPENLKHFKIDRYNFDTSIFFKIKVL